MRFVFAVLLVLIHIAATARPVNVYCFSGLGADERAFARLQLPSGYQPVYIQWVRPGRGEALADYVLRIGRQVDSTAPFVFLGLSFGGVVAQQLSNSLKPQKLILVSSFTSPAQIKGVTGFISRSGLYRVFPFGWLTIPNALSYQAFGAKDRQTRAMLHDILQDTSPQFFRWAAGAMTRWQAGHAPVPTIHIHGSADRIIPIAVVQPDKVVAGGSHLMIYNQAEEVNKLIAAFLGG